MQPESPTVIVRRQRRGPDGLPLTGSRAIAAAAPRLTVVPGPMSDRDSLCPAVQRGENGQDTMCPTARASLTASRRPSTVSVSAPSAALTSAPDFPENARSSVPKTDRRTRMIR